MTNSFWRNTILLISILLSSLHLLQAQVVNVESKRIQTDTTGWSGSIEMAFDLKKDAKTVYKLESDITVQHKSKKNLYLLLVSNDFLKEKGNDLSNSLFFHLRNTKKLSDKWSVETYTQYQYNKVTKINNRFLAGFGPRLRVMKTDKLRWYMGSSAMFEYSEEGDDEVTYNKIWRNSNYISFTWRPADFITIVSTTFYQPQIDKFSNYRMHHEEVAEFKVTDNFSIKMTINFNYNSHPVEGVPKSGHQIKTAFKYVFN